MNNVGMYDTIYANGVPIVPDGSYQTKSLDCGLDRYELRPDGSLWLIDRFDADSTAPTRMGLTDSVHFYGDGGAFVALYVGGNLKHLERK